MKTRGGAINLILQLEANHALYSDDGTWYHQLKKFPGVLFDRNGYLLVPTKESYESNPLLKRSKDLHIKDGISKVLGYRKFTSDQLKLLKKSSIRSKVRLAATNLKEFEFKPSGNYELIKVLRTKVNSSEKEISQIHRQISKGLYLNLVSQYGADNIACDCATGNGTYLDLIRKERDVYHLYEIKTYSDIRRNIREALGQLMEYAFWNFSAKVGDLIIVSYTPPTDSVKEYLIGLRSNFSLPVYYQHFDLDENILRDKN